MTKILIIGPDPKATIRSKLKHLFENEYLKVCEEIQLTDNTTCDIGIFMRQLSDQSKREAPADIIIFSNTPHPPEAPVNLKISTLTHSQTTIIINGDDLFYQKMLLDIPANIITYGLNYKSSITASSIEENMDFKIIQLCIQRSFINMLGGEVPAQELSVSLPASDDETTLNEIAAIAAALCYGVSRKTISLAY